MPFLDMEIRAHQLMRNLFVVLFGVLTLALSACTGSNPVPVNVAYQPKTFAAPDVDPVETARVVPGQEKIAPYDKLAIKVFQVEDLSGEYQVNSAGQISYPLLGTVEAVGKTPAELSKLLAARLGAKHLRSPNVQVNILEGAAAERTITVDGSVEKPGAFPVKGPISLMRAVALAQGLSDNADPKRVFIFRTVNGQKMAAGFDLTAIRRAEAEDPTIYANDIVVVDAKNGRLYSIFREVIGTIPVLSIFRPF
jgi:polysaccharide export outer membrane protein